MPISTLPTGALDTGNGAKADPRSAVTWTQMWSWDREGLN